MANEAVIRGAVFFNDGSNPPDLLELLGQYVSPSVLATTGVFKQSILTSNTALFLGPVVTPGVFIIRNLDPDNYVELLTGVAGEKFAKILPGECCLGRFSGNVVAPAAVANSAVLVIEGLILDS